jgi:hypothetical protein
MRVWILPPLASTFIAWAGRSAVMRGSDASGQAAAEETPDHINAIRAGIIRGRFDL